MPRFSADLANAKPWVKVHLELAAVSFEVGQPLSAAPRLTSGEPGCRRAFPIPPSLFPRHQRAPVALMLSQGMDGHEQILRDTVRRLRRRQLHLVIVEMCTVGNPTALVPRRGLEPLVPGLRIPADDGTRTHHPPIIRIGVKSSGASACTRPQALRRAAQCTFLPRFRCSASISRRVSPRHSQLPRSAAKLVRCVPYCLHIHRSA